MWDERILDAFGNVVEIRPLALQGDKENAIAPTPEAFAPISTMQLAVALMLARRITAEEAEAFGGAGIVPEAIRSAITDAMKAAGKSDDEVKVALVIFVAAAEYHRDHPLTPIVGAAFGMDDKALDDLWRVALTIR
jgi:hypothetical protein